MTELLRDALFKYGPWIIFVPLLLSIVHYKKYPPAFRAISHYMILAVLTQLVSFILWTKRINNFPVLHIYTILEFLLLLRFYHLLLQGFLPRRFFLMLAFLFPLFSLVNSLWVEKIFTFNTYSRSVEALIFIFLCISWFVKTVSAGESARADQIALRYIISGFLIYFTGSVALFSFGSYIDALTVSFRINIWFLHTLLAIVLYLLIAAGLWKQRRT